MEGFRFSDATTLLDNESEEELDLPAKNDQTNTSIESESMMTFEDSR